MSARRPIQAATVLGALGVALAWQRLDEERFWANWVIWTLFLATIGLGALFLVALEHLCNARWSVPIRRVAERVSSLIVLAVPLFLLALAALPSLFHEWTGAEAARHPAVAGKAAWLNVPFFIVRLALCVVAWLGSYWVLVVGSWRQDASRDPGFNVRARRFAPAFMALFALTVSAVSFDWISSIQPEWYSDMFGVYLFAGTFLAGLAAITLAVLDLTARGRLPELRPDHVYSLGGLLFAFTVFYGYIAFAQYMLIWYANLPEEVVWYKARLSGGWLAAALLLALIRFFIPFFALITRDSKSDAVRLRWVAVLVLVGHLLDLYWQVSPALGRGVLLSWPELAFALLFGGAGVLWVGRAQRLGADMPVGDPFLAEALEFHL
jgi:hypothetical protein